MSMSTRKGKRPWGRKEGRGGGVTPYLTSRTGSDILYRAGNWHLTLAPLLLVVLRRDEREGWGMLRRRSAEIRNGGRGEGVDG